MKKGKWELTTKPLVCPFCKKEGASVTNGEIFSLRCDKCEKTFEIRRKDERKTIPSYYPIFNTHGSCSC